MLLYNDTKAIEFGAQFEPPLVEIHSVCLNDIFLLDVLKNNIRSNTVVVFGVGGLTLDEIEFAINRIQHQKIILMFGFQNFPTQYENINFNKMRRIMKLFPEYTFGYADHTAWDEPNNILITLMGAALGVDVVEKHVTNFYGEERLDWNSAVSIQMFNEIADKLYILSKCRGDGLIKLNEGEEKYSIYGPMKKAAVLSEDVKRGEVLTLDKIQFQRTKETTDLSQLETIKCLGYQIVSDLNAGTVLFRKHLKK
jgi:sialic acid synthase SpsE